jgi:small subunit ribosomal protein S17
VVKNIGLNVNAPSQECDDPSCPFHGRLSVRGQQFSGTVVSDYNDKTVVVQREYQKYVPKYERYEKRRSSIHAHNPPCINARRDDIVRIAECRPISKTKSFVVVEVVK